MSVYVTIILYSVTNSVFFPVFQSLVFFKSCVALSNSSDAAICHDNETFAKNDTIHSLANFVLLISSSGLCVTAFFTSRFIGRLSDRKSRKLAMLVPFVGLILSDLTIIVQVLLVELPPYLFIMSEIIYGLFGGYMSITSSAFAIISAKHKDSTKRAKAIAWLEGTISFGSMIGFLISSQLNLLDYFGMSVFFLCSHITAFISALCMEDVDVTRDSKSESIWKSTKLFADKPDDASKSLKILYFSFASSYFAFIGSTRVLFFYLKHKFYWDTEKYGYLKAMNQAMTTVLACLLFPYLKNRGVSDVDLAILGLATRSVGRFWYAIAWNDFAVFSVVVFEMFSKFPATSLRSLISTHVAENERGAAFSLVAVIEAACNLSSSIVFHSAFPLSLSFFPELSFVVMPIIILPAIFLMSYHKKTLEMSSFGAAATSIEIEKLTA
ncbi:unnamed protein product [Caenorhabditis bovis]|uniref:Uncharacterized protein n=1 Tax=Caenorhabditis bovis TaxID=2654633 RepID=A0A8S1ELR7_9PELO|nr:unnamed protein product [Caenorhabditis bovis]